MHFLLEGLGSGFELIAHGDRYTLEVTWVTLRVAGYSTCIALLGGLPLGLAIGLGRFRGRQLARMLANTGLALPPVVVGLVFSLAMFPEAPLGPLHLLFTLKGVIVAQTALALPIVVALTSSAVQALPGGLLEQARAFGAGRGEVWMLALREARIGIFAATLAALGSAISEVGAVVLVGGNIEGSTQTLASATLEQVDAGHFSRAMAIGIVLMALIVLVMAPFSLMQSRRGPSRDLRRLSE